MPKSSSADTFRVRQVSTSSAPGENDGPYLTAQQILVEFHRQNPDFTPFAMFSMAGGQIQMTDLQFWNANYWSKGGSVEVDGKTRDVDLITFDDDWANTPENL